MVYNRLHLGGVDMDIRRRMVLRISCISISGKSGPTICSRWYPCFWFEFGIRIMVRSGSVFIINRDRRSDMNIIMYG